MEINEVHDHALFFIRNHGTLLFFTLIEPSKFLVDFVLLFLTFKISSWIMYLPSSNCGLGEPPTPSGGLGHKKTLWVSNGENTKDMHVEQSVFCDNSYHVSPGVLRKKIL